MTPVPFHVAREILCTYLFSRPEAAKVSKIGFVDYIDSDVVTTHISDNAPFRLSVHYLHRHWSRQS